MSEKQMRLGALEAGGTKMVCAVVSGDGEVLDRMETPTLAPAETVPQMIEWFAARDVDALGIGASARPASTPPTSATAPSCRPPSSCGEAMVFAPRSPTSSGFRWPTTRT